MTLPHIAESIRREIERECDDAEHPQGMSTHSGRTRIKASQIRHLLAHYDALRAVAEQRIADLENAFAIATKSADDQMFQKRDAEQRIRELESRISAALAVPVPQNREWAADELPIYARVVRAKLEGR